MTPQAWQDFFALVRDVRAMQTLYERTLDPNARREKAKLETILDAKIGWIAADLAADVAGRGFRDPDERAIIAVEVADAVYEEPREGGVA